MELFGFEFKKKEKEVELPSFVEKADTDDGAVVISAGGAYGTYVDLDGTVRSEAELVTRYREMALVPECDAAIDEIVNESIAIDEKNLITLDLDSLSVSPQLKQIIKAEFNNCLSLIDFNKYAYEIYRRWYIDGRLYYHVMIDEKNPQLGIQELRFIDPRKIRKVREVQKKKAKNNEPTDVTVTKVVNEYYIFNDKGFNFGNKAVGTNTTGLRIAKDSIIHVVSGITDNQGQMVLSYLHKAIKPLNQLSTLEDALVIYRLARAPERRIWYIDVGNLPKMKAEQYVRDIMVKHKNRLIYDANTGQIRDDRKFMTMLEDYWLPRREGGRGTEVSTLPGGQNLGEMNDVLYFQKKFLQSLSVPVSRLNSDALFSVGRATEITRDEVKFSRFIVRLRSRFSHLFLELLKKQLILKSVTTLEDWELLKNSIRFDFAKDNYFAELKDAEIRQNRVAQARDMQDMAGKYVSHEWIRRNVLQQSDDDIEMQDQIIMQEEQSNDPRWVNPMVMQNEQMQQQQQQQAQEQEQQAQQAQQQDQNASDNTDDGNNERVKEIRDAMVFVDQMKKRGAPSNRTTQEQSRYKSSIQLIAKNPDIVQKIGSIRT
jgi:hypothetical protein